MKWVICQLKKGDHIRVKRTFYYHHGIYVGDGKVIHYSGSNDDSISNPNEVYVQLTDLDFFSKDGIVEVAKPNFWEKLLFVRGRKAAVKRAYSKISQHGYNAFHHNCETLANECCYRKELTSQMKDYKKTYELQKRTVSSSQSLH